MPIRDAKFLPASKTAEHLYTAPVVTAINLTARPFLVFRPGYQFAVTRLGLGNRTEAGAVSIDCRIARTDGLLFTAALAKDAGEPEDMQVGSFSYFLNGTVLSKTGASGIDFSAAHVVTQNRWGAIAVQINASGTVSTKVPSSPQGYGTAAEAYAAIPAADANNVLIGAIVIQAKVSGNWTANTDDLTAGSDCQAITFYQFATLFPAAVVTPTTAALNAVSGQYVEATIKSTDAFFETVGSKTSTLICWQTTDGSGALTDGLCTVGLRLYPLNGEPPVDTSNVV